jgi:formylglycine-generating enzyme required for sulfatase activity
MKLVPVAFIVMLLCGFRANSNNLQIANVSVTGADFVNDYTKIEFDVSWDNGWRDAINWDAAWVFAKYSTDAGLTWHHAWLNTTPGNHTVPAGVSLSVGLTNIGGTDRGMGVFLYRSASGSGSNAWTNVQLRWEYGLQGVDDYAPVMIKLFGIEMVYVRDGSYWLGDGTTTSLQGQFESGTGGSAFQVTSEAALTLGGGGAGSLGNNNASGMSLTDDFNDATSKTLPAAFPKGYNAFYFMKYEVSQEQYRDFLNTLTRAQQSSRVATDINTLPITNRFVMTATSSMGYRNGLRCDASPPATGPIDFYCDYDGDGIYDESTDGQTISCSRISVEDVQAYLDWSCLRPLTELEFEKACRGPIFPVIDEFAWGNTTITATSGIANPGQPTETAGNTGANCCYGALGYQLRCGAYATGSTSRTAAGASYWGCMDMSGNISEMCVSVGLSTNRTYTGLHGDGELSAAGLANVTLWPSGLALRGGSYISQTTHVRTSSRYLAAQSLTTGRTTDVGGRGVRTMP